MPTFDLSKRITKYLAIAVGLMVLTIAATTLWMAHRHNELAAENSRTMVSGGLLAQKEELETLNVDYAWWDEALTNIVEENKEWLHWNMGTSVTDDEASLEHMVIVPSSGGVAYGWSIETGQGDNASTIPADVVAKMVDLMSDLPLVSVEAESRLVKFGDTLFLLSIARVTPQEGLDALQPGDLPLLIMGRDLSSERLAEIGHRYLIDDLSFAENKPEAGESIALQGLNDEVLGYLTWMPSRPGEQLLNAVMLPLAVSLAIFIFIAVWMNRHFANSVDIVETSLIRAQAADQAKTDFLANISHELRTPMNGVLTMAHVLKTTNLDEHQTSILKVILESSEAQMEIIDEVLDFSLLDSGTLKLNQDPFSISEMVDSAVALLDAKAKAKGLSLSSALSPSLPDIVIGDPVRVRQIVTNLLSNAVKFTENGSVKLDVSSTQEGNNAQISIAVSDTGIGISEDQRKNIFERFWQVDSSKTRSAGGNGLGLANVKITIEKLKGTINVESEPGKGSVFKVSFRLPVQAADGENAADSAGVERAA